MKRVMTILALTVAMTGCLKENGLLQEASEPGRQPADSVWTLTLRAEKEIPGLAGDDGTAGTKGLAIGAGGEENTTVLQSIWKDGEKVEVYRDGTHIGTLTATPDGSNAHRATLSGTVTTTGITPGNTQLTLLTPRKTWDYTGQAGFLLRQNDLNNFGEHNRSIENNYHYTMAENVLVTDATVDGEGNGTLAMAPLVTFRNQQSIYRLSFRFQMNGTGPVYAITAKRVAITAAGGGLVKTEALNGPATTGAISVILDTATPDPFFVSIRNQNTTDAEALSFQVVDNEGITYYGSKTIPAAYKANGTFVSIKNATLTSRLELEQGSTSVNTAL